MEKIFADGFIFKRPSEKAPDFVKGNISIKIAEFIPFVEKHSNDGWINLDLKESKGGKLYCELNTWRKDSTPPRTPQDAPGQEEAPVDEVEYPKEDINPNDIPF